MLNPLDRKGQPQHIVGQPVLLLEVPASQPHSTNLTQVVFLVTVNESLDVCLSDFEVLLTKKERFDVSLCTLALFRQELVS